MAHLLLSRLLCSLSQIAYYDVANLPDVRYFQNEFSGLVGPNLGLCLALNPCGTNVRAGLNAAQLQLAAGQDLARLLPCGQQSDIATLPPADSQSLCHAPFPATPAECVPGPEGPAELASHVCGLRPRQCNPGDPAILLLLELQVGGCKQLSCCCSRRLRWLPQHPAPAVHACWCAAQAQGSGLTTCLPPPPPHSMSIVPPSWRSGPPPAWGVGPEYWQPAQAIGECCAAVQAPAS